MQSSSRSRQVATSRAEARSLRREVRRHANHFVTQRISHREFIAAVRHAAAAAGVIGDRRPSRDERILNALAWGTGSIEPGLLPALLEPLFKAFEGNSLTEEEFIEAVALLLGQLRRPT